MQQPLTTGSDNAQTFRVFFPDGYAENPSMRWQIKGWVEVTFISRNCLNMQDPNGNTILHGLAQLGNPELFNLGLVLGPDHRIKDRRNRTIKDILHEKRLRSKRLKRDQKKAARYAQCLGLLKLYEEACNSPDKDQ